MRILVLYNTQHKNNYTACLHTLIEQLYINKKYEIKKTSKLSENTSLLPDNTVLFVKLINPAFLFARPFQQLKLKAFIRKNKIDLLVQHIAFFLKQKKIPQLLISDNIEKLPVAKSINHTNAILLTYSTFAQRVLIDKGFTNGIHIIPPFALNLFRPVSWSTKQQVKMDHAQGKEYFFVHHNFKDDTLILNLLKSFSGFKKWQHSSMKLIIAGNIFMPPADWDEKLATYKYRDDVVVYKKLQAQQLASLYAAAYAFIHLPEADDDVLPLLQAMQCHTPAITYETASVQEYAGNAALIAVPEQPEVLAQQMILIYKDEALRGRLIEASALESDEFAQEQAAQMLETTLQEILPLPTPD